MDLHKYESPSSFLATENVCLVNNAVGKSHESTQMYILYQKTLTFTLCLCACTQVCASVCLLGIRVDQCGVIIVAFN